MPEIVDLDALVPEDIVFKYRQTEYTIPGDLRTGQTLELYALLTRLARAEAKGGAGELKRIIEQCEAALLPIFQVNQPDMTELPFGAAGLGHVLRRVLELIGMLESIPAGEVANPPNRAARRQAQRSTRTQTKPGSASKTKPKAESRPKRDGSTRSPSSST